MRYSVIKSTRRKRVTVRQDKFKIGDKVTWANDDMANLTGGRNRLGNGPFAILKTENVKRHFRSVGHTQFVVIDNFLGNNHFSGAFFVKVD
jgi:hypothetical protein